MGIYWKAAMTYNGTYQHDSVRGSSVVRRKRKNADAAHSELKIQYIRAMPTVLPSDSSL